MIGLDQSEQFVLKITRLDDRYWSTGKDFKPMAAQENIVVRDGSTLGYFFISNDAEDGKLYVWKGFYHFLPSAIEKKETLSKILQLELSFFPRVPNLSVRATYNMRVQDILELIACDIIYILCQAVRKQCMLLASLMDESSKYCLNQGKS